jgi:hypothetical protein
VDLPLPAQPLANMTPTELQEWRSHLITSYYGWISNPQDRMQLMVACGYSKMAHLYSAANKHGVTSRRGSRGDAGSAEAGDPERLKLREHPDSARFSERDDEYLTRNFGSRRTLEEIALATGHTEIAMAVRARQLGLRQFCKYWELEKVLGWTGVSREELENYGMLTYPVTDLDGKVRITLASSSSLSRMVADPVILPLLRAAGCDEFFVLELSDLWSANRDDQLVSEPSCWISHAHTCLNPRAGEVFRASFSGKDLSNAQKTRNIDPRPFHIMVGAGTWRTPVDQLTGEVNL